VEAKIEFHVKERGDGRTLAPKNRRKEETPFVIDKKVLKGTRMREKDAQQLSLFLCTANAEEVGTSENLKRSLDGAYDAPRETPKLTKSKVISALVITKANVKKHRQRGVLQADAVVTADHARVVVSEVDSKKRDGLSRPPFGVLRRRDYRKALMLAQFAGLTVFGQPRAGVHSHGYPIVHCRFQRKDLGRVPLLLLAAVGG
jgi:hypothetical protein